LKQNDIETYRDELKRWNISLQKDQETKKDREELKKVTPESHTRNYYQYQKSLFEGLMRDINSGCKVNRVE